jgi:hypothetical protein
MLLIAAIAAPKELTLFVTLTVNKGCYGTEELGRRQMPALIK